MQRILRKLTVSQKNKLNYIKSIAENNPVYYAKVLEDSIGNLPPSIKKNPDIIKRERKILSKFYDANIINSKNDLIIHRMIVVDLVMEDLSQNDRDELFGETYGFGLSPDDEEEILTKYTKSAKKFVLFVENLLTYTNKLPFYIPAFGITKKINSRWFSFFLTKLEKKKQMKKMSKIKERSALRRFEMEYKPGGKEAKKLEQHFYQQQLQMFCEDLDDKNTLKDLKKIAKHLKLTRYSNLNKKQLCKKISEELNYNKYFIH